MCVVAQKQCEQILTTIRRELYEKPPKYEQLKHYYVDKTKTNHVVLQTLSTTFQFLRAFWILVAQRHGDKEGGMGDFLGTFRSFGLLSWGLRDFQLQGPHP